MTPTDGQATVGKQAMDLPPEVNERYERLARQRRWPPEVRIAFLESVAWIRSLEERATSRSYYERVDGEGSTEEGARWLREAVPSAEVVVAVKQIEVPPEGRVRRYSWRCLEDAAGGLTDQALSPAEMGLREISRETFYEVWGSE